MKRSVRIEEVIAKLDEAMEKYGTTTDEEVIRAVLSGPSAPSGMPPLGIGLNVEPLDDPEANQLFQNYVARYTEISGKVPSPSVLNLLKCVAEMDFLMEQQMRNLLIGCRKPLRT